MRVTHMQEESDSAVPNIMNRVKTKVTPPTYFPTTKYTIGMQTIINSYGVANYQEMNPGNYLRARLCKIRRTAPFSLVTFPFLFAVMFGDVGHGLIMLCGALFLVLRERKLEELRIKDEIFQMIFGGRYVLLSMSLFCMYTGMVGQDRYFSLLPLADLQRRVLQIDEHLWQ